MSFKGVCWYGFETLLYLLLICNSAWTKTEETSALLSPYYKIPNNLFRILRQPSLRFERQDPSRRVLPKVATLYSDLKLSRGTNTPGIDVASLERLNRHHEEQKESTFLTRLRNRLEIQEEDEVVGLTVLLHSLSAIFQLIQNNARVLEKVLNHNGPYWRCASVDCSLLSYLVRTSSRIKSPLFVG